jgi:hypothetical protein
MKPYYTKKGKYADGRQRIVIRREALNLLTGECVTKDVHLPKPELLLDLLRDRDRLPKNNKENKGEKELGKDVHLKSPKYTK